MKKTTKRTFLMVGAVLLIFIEAFLVDQYILDQGEDLAIPAVGIKAATLSPNFVTGESQPLLLVFVKGEASAVTADVAKRVAPTKGGETLAEYDLQRLDLQVDAAEINEEDTGELNVWAKALPVPEDPGQYLINVTAKDSEDVATKFKMFNAIMSVQDGADLKSVPAVTPGQATFASWLQTITADDFESAYEMLSPALRSDISLDDFTQKYEILKDAEVVNYDNIAFDLSALTEEDEVVVKLQSGAETKWQVGLSLNEEDPTKPWQINTISEIK